MHAEGKDQCGPVGGFGSLYSISLIGVFVLVVGGVIIY